MLGIHPNHCGRLTLAAAGIVIYAALGMLAWLELGMLGWTPHIAVHFGSETPIPQACTVAGSPLPSGDAARMWIPQLRSYQEFVCTDGTWIHITGYGN